MRKVDFCRLSHFDLLIHRPLLLFSSKLKKGQIPKARYQDHFFLVTPHFKSEDSKGLGFRCLIPLPYSHILELNFEKKMLCVAHAG
jgi:hypothetical protein